MKEYMALTEEERKKYIAYTDLMTDGMDKADAIYMVEHGTTPKRVVVLQSTNNTSENSGLLEIIKRRDARQNQEDIELKNALKESIDTHLAYAKAQAEQAKAEAEARVAQAKAEAEARVAQAKDQENLIYDWRLAHREVELFRLIDKEEMKHREEILKMQMQQMQQQIQQMQMQSKRMMQMTQLGGLSPSAVSVVDADEQRDHVDWRQPLKPMTLAQGAAGARAEAGAEAGAEVGAAAGGISPNQNW